METPVKTRKAMKQVLGSPYYQALNADGTVAFTFVSRGAMYRAIRDIFNPSGSAYTFVKVYPIDISGD